MPAHKVAIIAASIKNEENQKTGIDRMRQGHNMALTI